MTTPGIVDLAAMGEEFARDPYTVFAALRRHGPVHRVRMPEGADAWLVVGYQEARAVLADPRLSKQWLNAHPALPLASPAAGRHMLSSDPPDHARLRRLVAREFTARRVGALAPRVQGITDGLLDTMLREAAVSRDGCVDLVESFAFPLPITVVCELIGVPSLEQEQFREWSNTAVGAAPKAAKQAVARQMARYLTELLTAKRARPGDDLLSALLHTADEDGDQLSADEVLGMVWLLLVAGHETTVNLLSNGVLALLRHPDQLAALRAEPALLPGAVEEMLRYDGPVVTSTYRFTLEPVEIGGTVIPGGGELVLAAIADANRDLDRFPDAHRFDIRRETRGHLAFGHGIHYCLGAQLARLEGRIALRSLLDRAPGLRLGTDPAALTWRHGMLMRGPYRLPVQLT